MTKKDYELIASVFYAQMTRAQYETESKLTMRECQRYMELRLAIENPRFNKQKFRRACGIMYQ